MMVHSDNRILFSAKEVRCHVMKTQRNLKCILPSDRSQSQGDYIYIIPTRRRSRRGKTIETITGSLVAEG